MLTHPGGQMKTTMKKQELEIMLKNASEDGRKHRAIKNIAQHLLTTFHVQASGNELCCLIGQLNSRSNEHAIKAWLSLYLKTDSFDTEFDQERLDDIERKFCSKLGGINW